MLHKKRKAWKLIISVGASLALGGISFGVLQPNILELVSSIHAAESPKPIHFVNNKQSPDTLPNSPTSTIIQVDAIAIPAGKMSGDSARIKELINLSNGRPCKTGADCIKLTYKNGAGWGGILWWPPSCGESGTPDVWVRVQLGEKPCAINVLRAGDVRPPLKRLTLWAKGSKGGEVVEFMVGGNDVWPRPGRKWKVTLTPDWEQYKFDLGGGIDWSRVTVPFGWVATDVNNPDGAVFYLDDIQFEGS